MQGINLRFITVRSGREKNSPPGQWDRGNDGNAPARRTGIGVVHCGLASR
jgi:hypothetical protein